MIPLLIYPISNIDKITEFFVKLSICGQAELVF